jgi:hypothetical protein
MNIPKAYVGGFIKTIKLPRMLFILYLANLFTGILLALPFMGAFKNGFGQSTILSNLNDDFDLTAIANLLYYNGDGIFAIIGGIKWLLLAYFLLNIFLTGGIISTYNREQYSNSNFFGAGAYNFFRFLGLNIITITFQIIFLLAVYIPLFSILASKADVVESEETLYYIFAGGFFLHAIIFLIISMIGDYAKFYLVLDNSFNIFKGFWRGTKYVFGHFLKTFFLYVMMLFLPAVVMYVYLYFQNDLKMATGIGILIVFIIHQAFIFTRCFLRAWILGSQYQMYAYDFALTDPVQGLILKVFDQSGTKDTSKKIKEKLDEKTKEKKIEPDTQNQATGYAIDFNSTFSTENEIEADNKTLTAEEILNKEKEESLKTVETSIDQQIKVENNIDNEALLEETLTEETQLGSSLDSERKIENNIDNEAQLEEIINTETQLVTSIDSEAKIEDNIDNEAQLDEGIDNEAQIEENLDNGATMRDENVLEPTINETETISETAIEKKMGENIQTDENVNVTEVVNQQVTLTEDKTYSAGETVDFIDETVIEQQMIEQLGNEETPQEILEKEIEKKMLDKIEDEGTVIDKNQNTGNQIIPKSQAKHHKNKEIVVLEVNTVAEAIIQEKGLQGVSMVSDDIDGEAILHENIEEADTEFETETLDYYSDNNLDSDLERMGSHFIEVIEQNVLEGDGAEKHNSNKKTKDDDIIEFEL